MIWLSTAGAAPATETSGAPIALFVIVVAIVVWIGLRALIRSLRAGKAAAAIGADFRSYAMEALANAANIDGRVNEAERAAIAQAMGELTGAAVEGAVVDAALASAKLSKDELVAYLADRSAAFSRSQKTALLKALLSVFVADGKFDETEHAALVDYTAAVGFDRQSAPEMLRRLSQQFVRGSIT
jgi:uncharacterized membrane protein YebE (DUF533 family)